MIVLVTGAAGFIGAHVVTRIAQRWPAAEIVAADVARPDAAATTFWASAGARVTIRTVDVADSAAVAAIVRETNPSHVVHMAAVTPGPDDERHVPVRVLEVNLTGTINVADAATASPGPQRLVAFSSSAVYDTKGDAGDAIAETDRLRPSNLYAIAKAAGEEIVHRLAELRGVSCANLRVASAYGPLERPTGSRARMSHVYRLAAALRAGRPLAVCGPDVRRDFVHADDVAEAVAGVLAAPALAHEVYNVGSGRAVSLRETVALFESRGLDARWTDNAAEADIALMPADSRPVLAIERLRAQIGFKPRSLREGIASLFERTGPVREPLS